MSIQVALRHKTSYDYDRLVTLAPHILRLRPAPHCRTPIRSYSLKIEPDTAWINWQQDAFGNYLARLVFPERTRRLSFDIEVIADMVSINPFDFFLEPEAETYPFKYDAGQRADLVHYLVAHDRSPELLEWVDSVDRTEVRSVDFLVALNQRLANEISYLIRMEPGVQTCAETLRSGSGSCRDSSWLLVQILRHLGLAARFVSGYLVQLKEDERPVDGPAGTEIDFTDLHAWAEVYLPGAGWVGLDPTSGLFAGEGHIPLACSPHYRSAAPIEGASDQAEVTFGFENSVRRIHEDPRVTKPYTDEQWAAIDRLGMTVDRDLKARDVRLSMGGEPTFVSTLDMESPQWDTEALGEDKRRQAEKLLWRLKQRYAAEGLVHHGMGKWYPGEQLPRWALSLYWRHDGEPLWIDEQWLANPISPAHASTEEEAEAFIRQLARRLDVGEEFVLPGFEDTYYYLWREGTLPVNVDPFDSHLEDEMERARLRSVFERGLDTVTGFTLPLAWEHGGWQSAPWKLRRERMYLIPGDSPMGFRLPQPSLPYLPPEQRRFDHPRDPFQPRLPLAPHLRRRGSSDASFSEAGPGGIADLAPREQRIRAGAGDMITALCTEVRGDALHVFMPPLTELPVYLELVHAIEETASDLKVPVVIEGYEPPRDPRVRKLAITPDPGVVEVNVHPSETWEELTALTRDLYEDARQEYLGTEKFMLDGKHTGTGGGNHVTLGSMQTEDSPFLRRPDLLRSLVTFWQNHPSLSYLFSGLFIGPTSQAPRVDEARDESLYEMEIALNQVAKQQGDVPPWLIDRLIRHQLTDLTGNTHRAEFCIDKLYSPDGPTGRLGLVEFRAFEMPPHARMSAVQMLLLRALVSGFWEQPYDAPLVRWDNALHDRYMLPYFVGADFTDVLGEIERAGYPFPAEWFDPFFEFRFPKAGDIAGRGMELELRTALEPWHVLGEEMSASGTARYVDSSTERMQVKVNALVPEHYAVTCNGMEVPMTSTGISGEYVGGVRYKAWAPYSAMHPAVPATQTLVFDVVDRRQSKSILGCQYHVTHPGGLSYEKIPVNAREAETRRLSRFLAYGHTQGEVRPVTLARTPEHPYTLDLRRAPA